MQRVSLRKVRSWDLPLMLAWANNSKIWEYLPTSRKGENLTWEDHYSWWRSRTGDRQDWMIMVRWEGFSYRPVGVVHVTELQSEVPEVGLYIGETTLWGQGIGKEALRLLLSGFRNSRPKVRAVIHPHNKRSVALFTGLGFVKTGKAEGERKGQECYEVNLSGVNL